MTREELFQMVELLRDTAKLHQPNEEILTDVKAESFVFVMESVLSALSENKGESETEGEWRTRDGFTYCSLCGFGKLKGEGRSYKFCPCCGKPMIIAYEPRKAEKTETCNGCTHPCIMYEPTMKACEKKGR